MGDLKKRTECNDGKSAKSANVRYDCGTPLFFINNYVFITRTSTFQFFMFLRSSINFFQPSINVRRIHDICPNTSKNRDDFLDVYPIYPEIPVNT